MTPDYVHTLVFAVAETIAVDMAVVEKEVEAVMAGQMIYHPDTVEDLKEPDFDLPLRTHFDKVWTTCTPRFVVIAHEAAVAKEVHPSLPVSKTFALGIPPLSPRPV